MAKLNKQQLRRYLTLADQAKRFHQYPIAHLVMAVLIERVFSGEHLPIKFVYEMSWSDGTTYYDLCGLQFESHYVCCPAPFFKQSAYERFYRRARVEGRREHNRVFAGEEEAVPDFSALVDELRPLYGQTILTTEADDADAHNLQRLDELSRPQWVLDATHYFQRLLEDTGGELLPD